MVNEMDELSDAIANHDYDKSNALMQKVWERRPSLEETCRLVDLLDDDYDDVGTMYGLVHTIERAAPEAMYDVIATKLASMVMRSPKWTRLIIARNLAAIEEQPTGHSARHFLDVIAEKSDPACVETIRDVYQELLRSGEPALSLRHPLLN